MPDPHSDQGDADQGAPDQEASEAFRWGATWSSVQAEGVAPAADWSAWERDGRAPKSGDGNGFAVDFRDDLRLLAEMGFTDIRMTAEWARIEPVPGKTDHAAIDLYTDMLRHARDVGLRPWVTLHSTSLPGWFSEDERGFRDRSSLDYFWMRHVDRCAEAFGDIATGWVPIDDPVGWALRGYLLASRPPGISDGTFVREAIEGALEADHMAAQHLASGNLTTMCVRGVPTVFAAEDEAETQARWWAAMLFDSWIEALKSGRLQLPDRSAIMRPSWVDDFDYVGLTFDHPIGVKADGTLTPYPPGERASDSGFVPLSEELAVVLERVGERLPDRRLIIAGNGVATNDDEWREELISDAVEVLIEARRGGINVHGYFHDTAIDGYEWRSGFDTTRGLIARDRGVKSSGDLLADRMRAHVL